MRRIASSPAGELFGLPLTKSFPRERGKCRGVAVTKGEWLKAAKCREVFPLSRLTPTAPPQAVAPFGVLYKPLAKTRGRTASPHLHNLSRSPAVRRISHGGAIFHIAQAIFHCALAQFHCGHKPAYIVPVTTTVVTPGVTLTTPVVVSCVNVAAGTVSVVAAPVSGRVSTPAV